MTRIARLRAPSLSTLLSIGSIVLILVLYGATRPVGLTWAHGGQDGGELIVTASRAGVAHPPGYAVYNGLGWLWTRLPIGTLADRLLLASQVYALAAALLVSQIAARLLPASARQLAPCAGIILACGWTTWSQAIIIEVYTLSLLFFCAAWLTWLPAVRPGSGRMIAAGLVVGLAVTHHLSALLWIPGLIVIHGRWRPAELVGVGAGIAAGALLGVGLLLARAGVSPEANWGGLEAGWGAVFEHLTGRIYQGYVTGPSLSGFADAARDWAGSLPREIALPGLALAACGLAIAVRQRRIALLAGAVIWGVLLLALTMLYQAEDTREVYRLPLSAVMTLLVVMGAAGVMAWRRWAGWGCIAVVVIALVIGNGPGVSLRGERDAYRYLETLHAVAPPDAIIVTGGTRATFTVWYAVYGDRFGNSPTWVPIDRALWRWAWYRRNLDRLYPALAPFDGTIETWLRRPALVERVVVSDQAMLPPVGRTVMQQAGWTLWAAADAHSD